MLGIVGFYLWTPVSRKLAPLEILTEFIIRSVISQKCPHIQGSKLTLQHNIGDDLGTSHMLFSFAVKLLAWLNFLEFSEHLSPHQHSMNKRSISPW